jgi:hypothetical protein
VVKMRGLLRHILFHTGVSNYAGPALATAFLLPACALDTRDLSADVAPTAGSNSGSGGSASPPAGLDAPEPPACTYEGSQVDAGCETLVSNPGFDQKRQVLGWPPATQLIQTQWDKRDATGLTDSGSMAVNNLLSAPQEEKGETIHGALQCVPAQAGGVYDVAADVLIPAQETPGRAGIVVQFYPTNDCNASNVGTDKSYATTLVELQDQWQPVGGRFIVPVSMRSMEVELVAGKPFKPLMFTALFDNVLVQQK